MWTHIVIVKRGLLVADLGFSFEGRRTQTNNWILVQNQDFLLDFGGGHHAFIWILERG